MLSCTAFLERLYDDDCRAALAGSAAIPDDVAGHRRRCAECREEWEQAAADLRTLPAVLREAVPRGLEVRLQNVTARAASSRAPRSRVFDAPQALSWAALGAAVGVIAAASALPEAFATVGLFLWSLLGATVAGGASLARDAMREALG